MSTVPDDAVIESKHNDQHLTRSIDQAMGRVDDCLGRGPIMLSYIDAGVSTSLYELLQSYRLG